MTTKKTTLAKEAHSALPTLASAAAKALLLQAMEAQQVSPSELARRLGITRQLAARVVDPDHVTKIDTINEALAVLGKRLTFSLSDL